MYDQRSFVSVQLVFDWDRVYIRFLYTHVSPPFPDTKQQLWNGHLWSPSFFMSTLGNMSKDVVEQYIQNQLAEYNAGRPRH
ncbi:MAG: transposase [Staphylococcus equorum]|nr:transposase [Staphylococcus equorum]